MSSVIPLVPQRAARIATQLIELIELQKLNPGDRLPPERALADLLEVSRPSLREAFIFCKLRAWSRLSMAKAHLFKSQSLLKSSAHL